MKLERFLPQILGGVATMLSQVCVVRLVPVEAFGTYSSMLASVIFASSVALWGHQFAALRVVSVSNARGESGIARFAIDLIRRNVLVVSVAIASLLAFVGVSLYRDSAPWFHWASICIAAVTVVVVALSAARSAIGVALGALWTAFAPDQIVRPCLFLLLIYVMPLALGALDSGSAVMSLFGVSAFIAYLVGEAMLRSRLPNLHEISYEEMSSIRRQVRSVALSMGGSNILIALGKASDVWIISSILSPYETAIYVVVTRFADWSGYLYSVLDPVYLRRFAISFGDERRADLQRHVSRYGLIGTLYYSFLVLLSLAAGGVGLGMFGEDYRGFSTVLSIALCAHLINALTGPGGQVLSVCGEERLNLLTTAASLFVYGGVALFLTTKFGVVGATSALVIYQVLRGSLQAICCFKALEIRTWKLV